MVSLNRALAKRLAAIERHLSGHDTDILKIALFGSNSNQLGHQF
jgi:hypothetical protein